MSKGEERISDLLRAAGLQFEREKTFADLKHGRFRYDFFVQFEGGRVAIIELNGAQHYQYVAAFYKTKRDWRKAQEHDRRKISYALANDIPIFIIPYWVLPQINAAADLFSKKFQARTRWKNDEDWANKQSGNS